MKDKIMKDIKNDKISIRSRWYFIAKSIGLQSGLTLGIVMLIFFVNGFFYFVKSNNLLLSLHYGDSPLQMFLHSLPYDLVIVIVLLLLFLNYLIRKFDFSYSHPLVVVFSIVVLFSIFISFLLFVSNFNTSFGESLNHSKIFIPYISDFYLDRCCHGGSCP